MATVTEHMAVDQYGQTFHSLGAHPRKALLDRLGYKKASRMFVDKKDGSAVQTGYVIGPHWLTVFEVSRWSKTA